ncbi:hypothetical protein SDC9_132573 [bioreactor metagenome]|uniref:Uncharacterized protein n=1 Tax=bioreactor metagenome TaxID=1076179 RepID=A0A645DA50_9ZZZZ
MPLQFDSAGAEKCIFGPLPHRHLRRQRRRRVRSFAHLPDRRRNPADQRRIAVETMVFGQFDHTAGKRLRVTDFRYFPPGLRGESPDLRRRADIARAGVADIGHHRSGLDRGQLAAVAKQHQPGSGP